MGRRSTDRKVYMEPTMEEKGEYLSSSSSPTHKGPKSSIGSSPKRNTTTEELSVLQIGLKKLSSLSRTKPIAKLGSPNYEELRKLNSDTTHAAGIFPTSHPNHGFCPSPGEQVIVRIDEPTNVTPGRCNHLSTGSAAACQTSYPAEYTSRCSSLSKEAQSEVDSRIVARKAAPKGVLTEADSFDGEDQFQRRRSVSSSSSPAAEAGRTSPPVPTASVQPKVPFADECRAEGDGGLVGGLQSKGSYDFRNGLLREDGSASNECMVPGGGSSNSLNSLKPRKNKGNNFDFGVIPEADPSTRLIGAFLRRQIESGSNFLDLDMDMDEMSPSPKKPIPGSISTASDLEEKNPSPQLNPFVRDSSYGDLCTVDRPITSSQSASLKAGGSPIAEELRMSSDQSPTFNSSPQQVKQDVTINVGGEERYAKVMQEAVAAFRNPTPRNSNSSSPGLSSPASAGVRWRKNGSFLPSSPPVNSAEVEVLKAPAQYGVRPSYSRLKSRLADLPKPPPEIGKAAEDKTAQMKSGQARNSGQLKSGLMGTKLKKVPEDEEEDPFLKVSDLPEKFHSRDKGFWAIFQWLAFVVIVGALATVLALPPVRRMKRGGLMLWKWALLVMVVFSGRLISGWIIWALVFIIEKNFLLRKRVVYFVYALRKGVQNCLWLGLALLAWHLMIDPKVDKNVRMVKYVSKVLVCFLVAAIIVLVKTLIVKVFASSFHVNNYFERIQEALFNQYIMETLSGLPVTEFDQNLDEERRLNEEIAGLRQAGASGPSFSKVPDLSPLNTRRAPSGSPARQSSALRSGIMSGVIGKSPKGDEGKNKPSKTKTELNEGISVEHLQRLDISNISAWNMKRLMHIIKNSTLTHSLEETIYSEGMETEIQSEWQAKCAAKQIFRNVAKPGQKVIMEDDLLRFMGEEEMKKALPLFDGAIERKCISKQALKNWVVNVYRERRSLALSLNDTKTAVNKLHRMVDVLVGIVIIIISLLVLGIATTKLLLFMSSQILLLILVWGNTLKTVFEAMVFLFVMHPFDVGDRCVVDGMQLVVEEMNILTTVFLGDFNVKIWFPNSVLATKPIQNYYRSPEMGDGVDFIVQACTPVEKIAVFKEKIGRYIASKPNHWHQEFALNVLQMSEGERMKLSLGVKHTMNYQDMGEIVKRRSELLLEVKFCLIELHIEYQLPAQEVHIRQQTD